MEKASAKKILIVGPASQILGVKIGIFRGEEFLYAQNIPCLKRHNDDPGICRDIPIDAYLQRYSPEEQKIIRANIDAFITACGEFCSQNNVNYDLKKLLSEAFCKKLGNTFLRVRTAVRDMYSRFSLPVTLYKIT